MIDVMIFITLFIWIIFSMVFSLGDTYFIGRWGGSIAYLIFPKARKDAFQNMRQFAGIKDRKMVVSNFRQIMGNIFLNLHLIFKKNNISIIGKEYISSLKSANNGFFFVTLHYGLWEIIPFILEHLRIPTVVVFAPSPYPLTERLILKIRERSRAIYVPASTNIFKLMKWIKEGKAVGIMLDQHRAKRRITVPFFNGMLNIPEAPLFIAKKIGIPILPIFSEIGDGKITLEISQPIPSRCNISLYFKQLFEKYIQPDMENFIWAYPGLS